MRHGARLSVALIILTLAAGAAAAMEIRQIGVDASASDSGVVLSLSAPAGAESLVLEAFHGQEGISSLFSYQLDLVSASTASISASDLLGREIGISVTMPGGQTRYFHGICNRFSQGERTRYQAEIVPRLWLLTRTRSTRIFQEMSVPDILATVLRETPGLAFTMQLQGTFHPRTYVVQYQESDFAFLSRLMEEEGIFYFFRHSAGGHTMVLANTPEGHPDLAGAFPYRCAALDRPDTIADWDKIQEIRSGKTTLRDHEFELPGQTLEVSADIQDTVAAGQVLHRLTAGGADALKLYDYPGGYAKRFDGIDPGGAEGPDELTKIFEDGRRTVGIRMQEEAAQALVIRGVSTAAIFTPGHRFQLTRHFDGDGAYVLTSVQHSARAATDGSKGEYRNRFECIPAGLPFRPARKTPRPVVPGTQTAVVVGPPGEEIFTDKYGRVKVQFHWDREGRRDESSSCWVRVGALYAGTETGFVLPRVGWEVVVAFLEGDPDQPIIVGSVYNPDHLPPR
ncbi:MAG TPA: type VI secretion system tip protein TssI/VgrG [Candidatus Polarisedimenticolia bacterium]|nr:type VI secretion system tip protein TssI/VgrG [Candidatus Polarisedimenticolia bacterium]